MPNDGNRMSWFILSEHFISSNLQRIFNEAVELPKRSVPISVVLLLVKVFHRHFQELFHYGIEQPLSFIIWQCDLVCHRLQAGSAGKQGEDETYIRHMRNYCCGFQKKKFWECVTIIRYYNGPQPGSKQSAKSIPLKICQGAKFKFMMYTNSENGVQHEEHPAIQTIKRPECFCRSAAVSGSLVV